MSITKTGLILAMGIALCGCDPDPDLMKITWTIPDGECNKVMRGEIGYMKVEGIGELPYGNMTFDQAKTLFEAWKITATNCLGQGSAIDFEFIEGTNVAKFTCSMTAAFGKEAIITNATLPEVCQFGVTTNGNFDFVGSDAARKVMKIAGRTCRSGEWDFKAPLDGYGLEHRCWANLIAMRNRYSVEEVVCNTNQQFFVKSSLAMVHKEYSVFVDTNNNSRASMTPRLVDCLTAKRLDQEFEDECIADGLLRECESAGLMGGIVKCDIAEISDEQDAIRKAYASAVKKIFNKMSVEERKQFLDSFQKLPIKKVNPIIKRIEDDIPDGISR